MHAETKLYLSFGPASLAMVFQGNILGLELLGLLINID